MDNATLSNIVNADIDPAAAIVDTKLAQITTASKVSSTAITGLTGAIEYVIDNGGSPITTGIKGDIEVPFSCTLASAKMYLDTSAISRLGVWKTTYSSFPPTSADTIISSASGSTTFSTSGFSASKFSATVSPAWTTAITANDIIRFNVDANDLATRITAVLNYTIP